jgi:hypothetical protein
MLEKKPDAARLGFPGRTQIVGGRLAIGRGAARRGQAFVEPAGDRRRRGTGRDRLGQGAEGLFGTSRNPTGHAPKVLWATSRRDALDVLTLA